MQRKSVLNPFVIEESPEKYFQMIMDKIEKLEESHKKEADAMN